MKKTLFTILLMLPFLAFAQPKVPKGWDENTKPADSELWRYSVRTSDPFYSKDDALDDAFSKVIAYFAKSISTNYEGEVERESIEEGFESDVLDDYTITISYSNFKTKVSLSGVRILDTKIGTDSSGKYVATVLGCISEKDFQKAKVAVMDEETFALAAQYFMQKNPSACPKNNFDTYSGYVKSFSVILSIDCDKKEIGKWSGAMQKYLEKLYRNIIFYSGSIDSKESFIVLNNPDYSISIKSALDATGLFTVTQNGATINVKPSEKNSLKKFESYIGEMKDSKKIAVFGMEEWLLPSGDVQQNVNSRSRLVQGFKTLAQKEFSLSVASIQGNFEYYSDMKDYAESHRDVIPARYLVFVNAETKSEKSRYGKWVYAVGSFILYDIETGMEYTSSECMSVPMCATIESISDVEVKSASRTAVDNLLNEDKNPESFKVIMQEVFDSLL